MGIFDSKQIIELHKEIKRLNLKNAVLLSEIDGLNSSPPVNQEITLLKNQIKNNNRIYDEAQITIGELKEIIKYKNITIENSITNIEHNRQKKILQDEISELKRTVNNSRPIKTHNERNAGRKPRATAELLNGLKSLQNQGFSHSKIAKSMTETTGK